MNRDELKIVRKLAERAFEETSRARYEKAKAEDQQLLKGVLATAAGKKAKRILEELSALGKKLNESNGVEVFIEYQADYSYRSQSIEVIKPLSFAVGFPSMVGPAEKAHSEWRKITAKQIEDLIDQALLDAAGTDARELLAAIKKLLG
jgi:hypothetical protein